MSTTSSRNFTTLYSGSGSVVPQGQYGNANVVSLLAAGTDGGNTVSNIVATGNISAAYFIGNGSLLTNINAGNITGNVNFANTAGTAQYVTANAQANITSVGTLTSLSVSGNVVGGNIVTAGAVSGSGNVTGGNLLTGGAITATGNVTAANFFGNVYGNIVGNVDAAGSDTQIQFNTGNLLDASANLTFDKSTNILKVTGNTTYPTSGLEITANTITGNLALGNLVITNQFQGISRGTVVIDTTNLIVGQDNAALNTNAAITAIRNQALELTTTNAGAPSVYVGKYVSGNPSLTGNVDIKTSNVGGYAGTGNVNLSGNVYVSRNAQGADTANAKANLIVTDSVYINQNLSVAGNTTIDNLSTTGNITAGNFITGGNLYGNVVGQTFTGVGNANVTIRQFGLVNDGSALKLTANLVIVGIAGATAACTLVSPTGTNLEVGASGSSTGGGQIKLFEPGTNSGNAEIAGYNTGISGSVNLFGNTHIGAGVGLIGSAASKGNLIVANAVYVGESISATGNVTGGNILTAGNVSSAGNVIGAYLWGDGGNITGVVAGSHTVQFEVKNTSGGTINKGTPVYVTGTVGATTVLEVSPSRADTAATMPAIGLLEQDLAVNATGLCISVGDLTSVDTSTYTVGQELYVGATGGLTNARPADSYVVQKVGTVGRVNLNTGSIQINVWNIEDLPNLGTGNIWIGNAGNVATQTVLATYTGNIGAGNINVSGQVSATGNVRGGNVLVPINGRYYGDFTTGTASGRTVFQTTATGTSSATNLTAVPGNNHVISNTAFSSGLNLFANGADVGNSAFGYVRQYGNRTEFGTLAAGTGTVGNLRFSAGSAQIYLQNSGNVGINNADPQHGLAVNGNTLISGDLSVTGNISNVQIITATGNITSGNLITAGTISATANTANVLLSNVVITSQATNSGQQIYPVTPSDISGSNTTINPGRMLFGNGLQGNVSNGVDSNNRQTKTRFGFWDTMQVPANYAGAGENMVNTAQFQLAGNTNSSARLFASVNFNIVASEGAGNTFTSTGTVPAATAGQNSFVTAGNWQNSTAGGMANVGNVVLNTASGGVFGTIAATGSTIGNSYGVVGTAQSFNTGVVNNQIYFAAWDSFSGTPSTPGNVFVYYNPGTTNNYGVTHSNVYRQSANYYFLRNDDDVAQVKLGSLRAYHEYQYSTATSGTVNIDKNNAQVQFLNPTANVTIGDYQNFVTTANDGTNNDSQTDTVTLVIQQGATPYTVTMPTGNASIKYLGGTTTVGSTANAVSVVTIKAIRSAANAALYLTSISSEYT